MFAHLNSDLPLVFWWQGEFSDLFEDRLYRLLNRLIFDSSSWNDPKAGFSRLLEARVETKGRMITQDLSWTRSYFYRLAVARLFDDPLAQQNFAEIGKVRVKAHPEYRMAAFLLLAWVIKRSEWTVKSCEGNKWVLNSAQGKVIQVELVWDEGAAPIAELSIQAPECEVKITRERGNSHLQQAICAGGHCVGFSGPADSDEPEGLVASQLSRGGKNSLFLEVLPLFIELLEKAG